MTLKTFTLVLGSLSLSLATFESCSDDDVCQSSTTKSEIQQMLENFYQSVSSPSSRGTALTPVIDDIDRQTYEIVGDSAIQVPKNTRAVTQQVNADSLFDLAYVTFHIGKQKGYSVMSDDKRLHRIYFYTPDGEVGDTAQIQALKAYLSFVPQFAKDNIQDTKLTRATESSTLVSQVGPLLKTYWGQGAPYNNYAPVCTNASCDDQIYNGGHNPIGCVTTATAQFIAHCGKFHGTFYGNKNIDFASLTSHRYPYTNEYQQIAQFFHEVALCCQVKFGCGASNSSLKSAYQYLRDLGYNCDYVEGGIDTQRLYSELSKNIPHLIAGTTGKNKPGHMWVLDGLRQYSDGSYYYHCNWGWNSDYSWVYGNPYTAELNGAKIAEFGYNLRQVYTQSF